MKQHPFDRYGSSTKNIPVDLTPRCPICGEYKSTRQHRAKSDKCSKESQRRAMRLKT